MSSNTAKFYPHQATAQSGTEREQRDWDQEFIQADGKSPLILALAACYLNIPVLLELPYQKATGYLETRNTPTG